MRLTKTTIDCEVKADCDVKTENSDVKTENNDIKTESDVTKDEESPQVVVTAEKAAKPQNNMNPILFLNKQVWLLLIKKKIIKIVYSELYFHNNLG